MNLSRHAAVLWRFRAVAAGGAALALVLAFLATYSVGWNGGPKATPRGSETWTAVSSILVTQPGFPEGRVTLPQSQVDGSVPSDGHPVTADGEEVRESQPKDQVEFADPGRLSSLADLYSRFLTSDEVVDPLPGEVEPDQVTASPFLASAGGQLLPLIELRTTGPTKSAAQSLNDGLFDNLRGLIEEQQRANGIGEGKRVELKIMDSPETTLTSPRKRTAAMLMLVLVGLATLALTHLLESLRPRPAEVADELIDWNAVNVDEAMDRNGSQDDRRQLVDVTAQRGP